MRILLVEDELRLSQALVQILIRNHYRADSCADGNEGLELALSGVYDVIILDRMLPGLEGLEILRGIRKQGLMTPVLFLTAKDTASNRIEGLDAGAQDYLVKPFSKDELLVRIGALSRRPAVMQESRSLEIGRMNLDIGQCVVRVGIAEIKLTLAEAQLLELLIRNAGQVLSKEQILDRVWGFDSEVELNSVELHIYSLRKKIDFSVCKVSLKTVRGVGYLLKEAANG